MSFGAMPTYSYRCKECNHSFEAFQSMKDEPLSECPECKGPVERLIGAGAGIVFKGSGFYVTDYKNNGSSEGSSTNGAKSDSAASAASSANSSTTSKTGT